MQLTPNEFTKKLNAFSEMLKETHHLHAENIVRLGKMQKELAAANKILMDNLTLPTMEESEDLIQKQKLLIQEQVRLCKSFEITCKTQRPIFQQFIDDTNLQLGMFSSHWGGYIEWLGVQYMLATLKRDYAVHTTIQKFKRWWHKSRNVEIDLLAISNTHLYVVEVKSQLKEETFLQMLTILEKIKDHLPEYGHLKIQPIFMCVDTDEQLIRTSLMGGIWILRYIGVDNVINTQANSFEWLRKDL
jgi:hypothetical protein